MKTSYLLSNKFKPIGWVLILLGLVFGIFVYYYDYQPEFLKRSVLSIYDYDFDTNKRGFSFSIIKNNIADEIALVTFLIGALLIGFSKEKIEDEFVYKLRSESLIWAVILNSILLIFAIIFVYDISFLDMMVYNMFTPLLFFIVRFNFLKYKYRAHEE